MDANYKAEAEVWMDAEEDVNEEMQWDAVHTTTLRAHTPTKQMCSCQRCPKDAFNMLLFISLTLVKAC